ncbi:MAG: RNA polymerase sigma factor [Clostridia bacterium]|nr:RNA polymerase sigma factor [Clostridia bacterium]
MDRESFTRRVEAMQGALWRVAYGLLLNRADCADAVQEALLRAWEKRGSLREEAYFETWLTRILINECYSMLRRRRAALPLDGVPEPAAPPDADPILHDAIARLDVKLRLPVVLRYMEGYGVNEIARTLRVPPGTVKTRLARARALLRLQLSDEPTEGGNR